MITYITRVKDDQVCECDRKNGKLRVTIELELVYVQKCIRLWAHIYNTKSRDEWFANKMSAVYGRTFCTLLYNKINIYIKQKIRKIGDVQRTDGKLSGSEVMRKVVIFIPQTLHRQLH